MSPTLLPSERCEETAVDAPSAAGSDRDGTMQDPVVEGQQDHARNFLFSFCLAE